MAWQSLSGMGSGGNGGGSAGGDPGQQVNQPQGTEYTLQGTQPMFLQLADAGSKLTTLRCDALPPNRMASARTRSERLGNRTTRNERENCEVGRQYEEVRQFK
jgi:hypothetical protein